MKQEQGCSSTKCSRIGKNKQNFAESFFVEIAGVQFYRSVRILYIRATGIWSARSNPGSERGEAVNQVADDNRKSTADGQLNNLLLIEQSRSLGGDK